MFSGKCLNISHNRSYTLRTYDAVGPGETAARALMSEFTVNNRLCRINVDNMTMLEMLYTLSKSHSPGRKFRPVSIDYRNMERMLNIQSLGRCIL